DAPPEDLGFWNGLGGFTPDGREYVIVIDGTAPGGPRLPPAPWINVLANAGAGCLASEAGPGYTWAGNSQMNRLTPWSNDPVSDPPGEAVYLRDEATGEFWTPTPLPCGAVADRLGGRGGGRGGPGVYRLGWALCRPACLRGRGCPATLVHRGPGRVPGPSRLARRTGRLAPGRPVWSRRIDTRSVRRGHDG